MAHSHDPLLQRHQRILFLFHTLHEGFQLTQLGPQPATSLTSGGAGSIGLSKRLQPEQEVSSI